VPFLRISRVVASVSLAPCFHLWAWSRSLCGALRGKRSEVGVGLARLRSDVATKGSGTMPFGGRGSPSARRFLVFASARAALLSFSLKLKLCFAYFFPRSLANRPEPGLAIQGFASIVSLPVARSN